MPLPAKIVVSPQHNPPSVKNYSTGLKSVKSEMFKEENWVEKIADFLTDSFGRMWFLAFHVIFFSLWILLNTGIIPGIAAFDPYPFSFLTMVVSLEAIFLSIIVLMSQNRASFIGELREEVDLRINIRAEREITKILNILDEIHDHLGLNPEDDDELKEMKQTTNVEKIRQEISDEIRKVVIKNM